MPARRIKANAPAKARRRDQRLDALGSSHLEVRESAARTLESLVPAAARFSPAASQEERFAAIQRWRLHWQENEKALLLPPGTTMELERLAAERVAGGGPDAALLAIVGTILAVTAPD